jgi:hypothetical protein
MIRQESREDMYRLLKEIFPHNDRHQESGFESDHGGQPGTGSGRTASPANAVVPERLVGVDCPI